MTSSQDQPLTRRELRELERVREQSGASTTPADASRQAAPAAPTYPAPPAPFPSQPAPVPVPGPVQQAPAQQPNAQHAPTYAPRAAGATAQQSSPFGGPIAAPDGAPAQAVPGLQPEQRAPIPSVFAPREAPQAWSRQESVVPSAPVVPAPPQPPQPQRDESRAGRTPERTLTRRELRALIDHSEIDAHEDDDVDEAFGSLFGESATPQAPSSAPSAVRSAPQGLPSAPLGQSPASAAPTPPLAAQVRTPAQPAEEPRVSAPEQPAPARGPETPIAEKPVGHWTSQLEQPVDRPEPFDQLLSRGSHGVPTTTNALILPSLPNQGAIGHPIVGGAELIVTGSIELPRSFGATGLHPSQLDSSDLDRLFEDADTGTGVAPVAATSAISTQGAAKAMLAPPKKEGLNAPLILAITAGVLALGVVTTFVIGAVAGLF